MQLTQIEYPLQCMVFYEQPGFTHDHRARNILQELPALTQPPPAKFKSMISRYM